jgi:hypothetical protein
LPFVGRDRHFHELGKALQTQRGQTVTAYVHGGSGMGKSALAQRFRTSCATKTSVVVLKGCCYERESVPYKASTGPLTA